jgi:hypothetical protein
VRVSVSICHFQAPFPRVVGNTEVAQFPITVEKRGYRRSRFRSEPVGTPESSLDLTLLRVANRADHPEPLPLRSSKPFSAASVASFWITDSRRLMEAGARPANSRTLRYC